MGVCGPPLETLTLFQTKICDFPYPISDLTQNFIPYFRPGPGCIKQLKIKWEFMQPFPVLRKTFFHAIMDKSTEGDNDGGKESTRTQEIVAEIPT